MCPFREALPQNAQIHTQRFLWKGFSSILMLYFECLKCEDYIINIEWYDQKVTTIRLSGNGNNDMLRGWECSEENKNETVFLNLLLRPHQPGCRCHLPSRNLWQTPSRRTPELLEWKTIMTWGCKTWQDFQNLQSFMNFGFVTDWSPQVIKDLKFFVKSK